MLDYVRSIGHKHVVKVFPGVDTSMFHPQPAGWQRNGYLLAVCRLDDPRKGLDRMIRAYAHMVEPDAVPDSAGRVADRVLYVLRGDGAALGACARDRCTQTFSSDVAIQRFIDTYEQLLARESA